MCIVWLTKHSIWYKMQLHNKIQRGVFMFENIDKKIQKMAGIFFGIGTIGGILLFMIFIIMFLSNADCLEYAWAYGGSHYSSLTESGNTAYIGMIGSISSIITVIVSIIFSILIFGFGELIQQVTEINKKLSQSSTNTNSNRNEVLINLKNKGLITEDEYQKKIETERLNKNEDEQ